MLIKKITKRALLTLLVSPLLSAAPALANQLNDLHFKKQPLGHGVYEMAYAERSKQLFAASAPSFDKDSTTGLVFELNPHSLAINKKIKTDRRAFAVALDEENHTLYLGNALDGSVTLMDIRTGKAIATLQLSDDTDPAKSAHVREIVLDKKHHRLYVSGIGSKHKGLLWVVDTQRRQLINTFDKFEPVGFAVDSAGDRVYVVTGQGELIVLDATTSQPVLQTAVDPADTHHYFLNIALNTAAGVGYIADTNTRDVLVVRLDTGKLIQRIPTPNSVAVLYNAARHEVYVTHRNARQISVIDATNNHVKHTLSTDAMPNSLVLSPDAKTLYVSVKQDEETQQDDYILTLDLTKL